MSSAVEIESLAVRFGDLLAVSDVSLAVDHGAIEIVLGPNGAGKTTTVDTLLGFRAPDTGRIAIMGLDPWRRHDDVTRRTGALLQRGGVWFPMSPRAALRLTATYYERARNVDELLERLSLTRAASTPWRRLSGGEQQRTLLALALLGSPDVLVLDEPTSAVDPEGHQVIRDILREERARGCAILITTHQLADAEALGDHLTVLHEGRVIAAGTPTDLAGDAVLVLESSIELDTSALAVCLGAPVTREGPRQYRCPVANSTQNVAALTSFLSEHGAQLVSLRSRASLEERYLALLAASRTTETS